jgi:hypothetical protein
MDCELHYYRQEDCFFKTDRWELSDKDRVFLNKKLGRSGGMGKRQSDKAMTAPSVFYRHRQFLPALSFFVAVFTHTCLHLAPICFERLKNKIKGKFVPSEIKYC